MSHIWHEKGNYDIRVKVKDIHGYESEWSDPLSIILPKRKAISIDLVFLRILGDHPSLLLLFKFLMNFILCFN